MRSLSLAVGAGTVAAEAVVVDDMLLVVHVIVTDAIATEATLCTVIVMEAETRKKSRGHGIEKSMEDGLLQALFVVVASMMRWSNQQAAVTAVGVRDLLQQVDRVWSASE